MKSGSLQQRAASGVVVGIVGLLLNLAQSILQVPILLHYWNTETYGLWGALLASVGLITSLDSGHQNYLGNRLCAHWGNSPDRLRHELSSGIRAATVLASLGVVLAGCILVADGLAWFGLDPGHATNASIVGALALYLVYWAVFGSAGGILVRLYPPAGLFARGQWLGIISRFFAFSGLVGAAACGGSVFEAMAAQVIIGTLFNLFLFRDLHRQFPSLTPWWRGGSWTTAWENFRASLMLTVNGVVEQLASNGLVLLVGRLLSPIAVALFTTVRTVANIGLQGSAILLSPLAPDLVRYHVKGEGGKLAAVFSTSWFLGTSLLTAGLMAGVFVLEPLYSLWTRGALPLDRMLFAYLGTAVAVRQWAAPFQTYLASMNRLRSQSVMALTRVVLGLGLAALLMPRLGLPAAGLGALAAEVGAAMVSLIAVRPQLRSLGAAFPVKSAVCSLVQVGLAATVWILFSMRMSGMPFIAAAGLLLVAILTLLQWRVLPGDVRARLLNLVRRRAQQ